MHFHKVIRTYDFIRNREKICIYKWINGSIVIFLVLYMDDILLIENDVPALQEIKVWLSSQFFMKDLEELSYILGMKIHRDRSKRLLGLSQSMYIDTVLKWFSMENSKKGYLSIGHIIFFLKRDCPTIPQEREHMSRIPYALVVRSIMYVMPCMRPDVAYSLGIVSRY